MANIPIINIDLSRRGQKTPFEIYKASLFKQNSLWCGSDLSV